MLINGNPSRSVYSPVALTVDKVGLFKICVTPLTAAQSAGSCVYPDMLTPVLATEGVAVIGEIRPWRAYRKRGREVAEPVVIPPEPAAVRRVYDRHTSQ